MVFAARADLAAFSENVSVDLNGTALDTVFDIFGADCPSIPITDFLFVPEVLWNAAVASGHVTITMTPSHDVDNVCANSFISVEVEHALAGARSLDCNTNNTPDECDVASGASRDCNSNHVPDECDIAAGEPDCNANGEPDTCELAAGGGGHDCNTNGRLDVCEPECNTNGIPDECEIARDMRVDCDGNGLPDECQPALYYDTKFIRNSAANQTWANVGLIGFLDEGPTMDAPDFDCGGQRCSRLVAGRLGCTSPCKVRWTRYRCPSNEFPAVNEFSSTLKQPESVLVDQAGLWSGVCGPLYNIFVGGREGNCDIVYLINRQNGFACAQAFEFVGLNRIGQMALDSTGRLYLGSVEGNCVNRLTAANPDHPELFFPRPCGPPPAGAPSAPRAVAVDRNDDVWITCSTTGDLHHLRPDGTPVGTWAAGLQGAVSQAIAPPGIFREHLFVACGNRIMEVDMAACMPNQPYVATPFFRTGPNAYGIAFDPEGYMHVSDPVAARIMRIGPGLPGDMNGDGCVNTADVPGFVTALLRIAGAAPPYLSGPARPYLAADMNCDRCADGDDAQPFVNDVLRHTVHPPCGGPPCYMQRPDCQP